MKRHAFGFGTAVSAFALWHDDPGQRAKYREEVKNLFNYAVMDNALKWPPWDGVWGMGRAKAIESVDWLRGQALARWGEITPEFAKALEALAQAMAVVSATELPEEVEPHLL